LTSSDDSLNARVNAIKEKLVAIDPRFIEKPKAHPFQPYVNQGAAALPKLFELSKDEEIEGMERLYALDAIAAIAKDSGLSAEQNVVLAELGQSQGLHPDIRSAATRALIIAGDEAFLKAFENRLASDSSLEATSAAYAMGVARYKHAVPALIELVAKTQVPSVRSKAAWALGEIADPDAEEILTAAFRNEKSMTEVLEALGKCGSEYVLPDLTVGLRDEQKAVRQAAAEAMVRIFRRYPDRDWSAAKPYLNTALKNETDPFLGVLLISALTRIGVSADGVEIQRILGGDLAGQVVKGYLGQLLNTVSPDAGK